MIERMKVETALFTIDDSAAYITGKVLMLE